MDGEYRDPILETLCYLYLICPLHISPYLYGAQSTQIQHAGQMQCKMFDNRRCRGGWGPVSSDTIVTTDDRGLMVASDRRRSTASGPCQNCTVSITTRSPYCSTYYYRNGFSFLLIPVPNLVQLF